MIVIGLMSGTSADGIDAAVVSLEGAPPSLQWQLLAHVHRPHPPELRGEILACCRPETGNVARLCRLNFTLGRAFADAVFLAASAAGLTSEQVDLIGSHGQTIWHVPPRIPGDPDACTLQIGEAAIIAEETGVTTVSNFRARDVAAGGHGAPLVAYVDRLLFTDATRPRACQNIGGIANVTYLPPASDTCGDSFAFDTGPGNMLMDDAATRATNGAWTYDVDGALAAAGRVDETLLAGWLDHPYFRRRPPKTTGRELFGVQMGVEMWEQGIGRGLRGEDIVATLTALTARSIAAAYRDFLPAFPNEVIVSGGGARNPALIAMLEAALRDAHPDQDAPRIVTSDTLGLPAEAKEAVAFAVLAYESWHGRPGNDPASTGARGPVVLGDITPGRLWSRTPDQRGVGG